MIFVLKFETFQNSNIFKIERQYKFNIYKVKLIQIFNNLDGFIFYISLQKKKKTYSRATYIHEKLCPRKNKRKKNYITLKVQNNRIEFKFLTLFFCL